uniref:Uncharacterized protein n=1 Tax=Romanomermis culicivorax TaxID=13658 RepID=A0A915HZY2_ROMCU
MDGVKFCIDVFCQCLALGGAIYYYCHIYRFWSGPGEKETCCAIHIDFPIRFCMFCIHYHLLAPSQPEESLATPPFEDLTWTNIYCCNDCTKPKKDVALTENCGVGKCNFFNCNCDGGCRKGSGKCTDEQFRACQ